MTDSPQSSTEPTALSIEGYKSPYDYAVALRKGGFSNSEIRWKLVSKGMGEQAAKQLVSNIQGVSSYAEEKRASGLRDMMIGGAIFLVGCILTYVGYSAASRGGSYIVFWGAIVFGGVQFLRGLSRFMGDYQA